MKETNRRILVPSFSFTLSLLPLPSLPIPFATPDVVLGRNNNFPKSDEIGRRGVAVLPSAGVSSGRVTAFIDCFKAVSMRDTLSLNNEHPSSLSLYEDFSSIRHMSVILRARRMCICVCLNVRNRE